MRHTTLVAAALAAGAMFVAPMPGAFGGTFSIDVDGLEGVYGGFVGDIDKETTYDFGLSFASIDAAVLSLSGQTDNPGSQLTFIPELDGSASPPTVILSGGTFDITLDLVVGPGAFDGAGDIALLLDTFSSMGADFASGVNEAVLTFVATPAGCLGDTDGDGFVGIDDLVNVVLCFGTSGIDCPAAGINTDVNGDGIVNVDDIVIVVLNFGPCPAPLGRCCFDGIVPPQLCQVTTEQECSFFVNSTWTPDIGCDVRCEPVGRCCLDGPAGTPGGGCQDVEESVCTAFGGTWDGDLTCETPCTAPLGRCCFNGIVPPQLCAETTEAECMMFNGGVWTPGINCRTPCEPDGRCCYVDAAGGQQCTDTPESACFALFNGDWDGDLTCETPCTAPLGRCCFDGIVPPQLCQVTTELECSFFVNGTWTAGIDCETPCSEPLGRCCFDGIVPPQLCQVTTELECSFFVNSTWTAGIDCTIPCEANGRCCFFDQAGMVACQNTPESACLAIFGGTWTAGLTCATPCFDACPALCGPAFDCVEGCGELIEGVECILFQADAGGLFVLSDLGGFGVGDRVEVAGCFDPNCATFCQQGNGCIFNFSIVACPEPLGRCCFFGIVPPQLCEVTTETECGFFVGGTWTEGLDCDDPCEEDGQCCYFDAAGNVLCVENPETACITFFSGTWTAGLTCADPCAVP